MTKADRVVILTAFTLNQLGWMSIVASAAKEHRALRTKHRKLLEKTVVLDKAVQAVFAEGNQATIDHMLREASVDLEFFQMVEGLDG